MAIRYYKSGAWNSTSSWSTTSGGAGGASVPSSTDDVIFDINSLGVCSYSGNADCKSWTVTADSGCTGYSGSTSYGINIYGNITILKPSFTIVSQKLSSYGSGNFNTADTVVIPSYSIGNVNTTVTLLSSLNVTTLNLAGGTLAGTGININATAVTFSSSVANSLNLTNCRFTTAATSWYPRLNFTSILASTSEFIFTGVVATLKLCGSYGSIDIANPAAGISIADSGTVGVLTLGNNIGTVVATIGAATTITVNKLVAKGTSTRPFQFIAGGTGAAIRKTGILLDELTFCSFSNIDGTGFKLPATCIAAGTSTGFEYVDPEISIPFSIRSIGQIIKATAATSFVVSIPVGATAGDVVIATALSASSGISTFSNGFSKLTNPTGQYCHAAYKILSSYESSVTINMSVSTILTYQVMVIKGCKSPQVRCSSISQSVTAASVDLSQLVPDDSLGVCPSMWIAAAGNQSVAAYFYNVPTGYVGGKASLMTASTVWVTAFKTSIAASENPEPFYKVNSAGGTSLLISIRDKQVKSNSLFLGSGF